MPTYEFMAEDGSIIEETHSIKAIPKQIVRDGKRYKRVAFSPSNKIFFNDAQVRTSIEGYPREDITFPKGDLGHGVGPHGNPIIQSQAHEREVMAKHNMWRD